MNQHSITLHSCNSLPRAILAFWVLRFELSGVGEFWSLKTSRDEDRKEILEAHLMSWQIFVTNIHWTGYRIVGIGVQISKRVAGFCIQGSGVA